MNVPRIDKDACQRCGACVEICPQGIFSSKESRGNDGEIAVDPERAPLCIACGHCMAVCPAKAVRAGALEYGRDVVVQQGEKPDPESVQVLLETRRACRAYKDEPVPRRVLEDIVDRIATAPPGFPPWNVELTVVQRRETLEKALPAIVEMYEKLEGWMGNPFVRFFMKHSLETELYNTIRDHLLPILKNRLPEMKEKGRDLVTWGAPAMILFHADRASCNHTEDAHIAVMVGWLAAHALGLGATAIGLVPPAVDKTPSLRERFAIPGDNEVVGCLILGYPKHRIKRSILRKPKSVTWI